MRRAPALLGVCALLFSAAAASAQVAIPAAEPGKCSLTWTGFENQIEQLLVDGKVLTESIGTALAAGRFARVPIINGMNHDEERLLIAGGAPVSHRRPWRSPSHGRADRPLPGRWPV